jgi:type III pantothenate kinase
MLLCIDVGNTHILAGIFKQEKLIARFRYSTHLLGTSDQFGIFLLNLLQHHHITPEQITAVALCSVVPSCDFTIKHTIKQYFQQECFILKAGVKTGLQIKYKNPNEVGADRIANAIGASAMLPHKNIIIVDMGTATTIDAVSAQHDYLGGAVLAGMRLGMEALKMHTAKLVAVDIEQPKNIVGRTTRESIQSGLFFGHLGAVKEIIHGMRQELFSDSKKPTVTVGTGGFAQLFKTYDVFDLFIPDLVLQGLKLAYEASKKHNAEK